MKPKEPSSEKRQGFCALENFKLGGVYARRSSCTAKSLHEPSGPVYQLDETRVAADPPSCGGVLKASRPKVGGPRWASPVNT